MTVETLSRIQFALTVGFHFLFPPISIGLAWLLVIVETIAWRTGSDVYDRMGRFFGRLLGLTFVVGVATGIPMEFQFGMNWSRYSKFVGDIFGAPLAAEGVIAFFLESSFLGLYLLGRGRVAKKWHWLSILMVAVGSTFSAFFILAADSWMQTPAGYAIRNGRAELTNFFDVVFNPSTLVRVLHTVTAALVAGSFFMAGIAAYLVRKFPDDLVGRKALKIAVVAALVTATFVAFPFGHEHARQVARTQPEKFAAIEGLYSSQSGAPLVMFAIPFTPPPTLKAKVELPGFLSLLAFGDIHAPIRGIDEFPAENRPPLWLTFVAFHNMVVLGMFFIFTMACATVQLCRGKLLTSRRLLKVLTWSIPLPLIACQLGWMSAEVGRQPWIVYHVMRTADAFSPNLNAAELWFTLVLFALTYVVLGCLYIFLLVKKVQQGATFDADDVAEGAPKITEDEQAPEAPLTAAAAH
jgi:cytochrome d ubiquinol oxidase subunit I